MTRSAKPRLLRLSAALAAPLALAACADRASEPAAPAAPTAAPPPAAEAPSPTMPAGGAPDARGVVTYQGYTAVVARQGDTVRDMAARVGISPSELAAYNGLPTSYIPQPGDELVLPPRAGGYPAASSAAPQPSAPASAAPAADTPEPLSEAPAPAQTRVETAQSPAAASGWDPARIGAAIASGPESRAAAAPPDPSAGDGYREVAYHEVQPDETVYSIARDNGVRAETLIRWNALSGPSYSVRPGQVLVIPRMDAAGPGGELTPPGDAGDAAPPPSAAAPLPPDTVQPRPLTSPQLGRYQTAETRPAVDDATEEAQTAPADAGLEPQAPTAETGSQGEAEATTAARPSAAAAAARPAAAPATRELRRPVPGEIVKAYDPQQGGGRNDGVEFAADPGEPVRAAADGEVALVSTSLGEWGNIVLLRHDDRLMTVYGRLGTVAVTKGEQVRAGDVIGDVARPESGRARLHFEVRRGAFSENPADYL